MPEKNVKSLKPHIVAKVWGGERLSRLKSVTDLTEPIGETWEISVHPDGESLLEGQKLSSVIDSKKLPYLVKLIDTSDDLSIQVHPADAYAAKHENSMGKTECWVILAAKEGAGIYLGLQPGVTKEKLETALAEKDDISKLLRFYPVKTGQFFYVPAGTIHALGKDVFLAEIQQSSGITYRVWDWNRLGLDGKPRELHVDKALDVINFDTQKNEKENFKFIEDIFNNGKNTQIISHKEFVVRVLKLDDGESFTIKKNEKRYHSILCLQGKLLNGECEIPSFSSGIILEGKAEITASGESIFLLIS